jgi:hypothetical protein
MTEDTHHTDHRTRRAVRRLLDAVDRALAAAREVAEARAALDEEARRQTLRVVAAEPEGPPRES